MQNLSKCDLCHTSTNDLILLSCNHRSCFDCFYKICMYNKNVILKINWESEKEINKELDLKCLICPTGTLKTTHNDILKKLTPILTEGTKSKWEMCASHKKEINVYCIQCKILMCNECFNLHKVIPVFSSHQQADPSKYLSFPSRSCREHQNQSLKKYCVECKLQICDMCLQKQHEGHDCKCIKDYFILMKEEIASKFIHPSFTFNEITKKLEDLNLEMKRKMRRQVTELKDKIHSLFSLLKEFMIEIDNSIEFIENQSDKYVDLSKIFFKKLFEDLENVSSSSDYDLNFAYLEKITKYFRLERVEVEVGSGLNYHFNRIEDLINNNKSFFSFREIPEEFKLFKTLNDHSNDVNRLILLKNGKIASASSDKTIRIWNPEDDFRCIHILKKHSKPICDIIELKDGKIASSSMDSTIIIWNLHENNYNPLYTIEVYTHHSTFYCLLELEDGRIASGSYDFSIRLFDPKSSYKCETLGSHNNNVRCLIQLKDGRIVSCSDDKTIKIWKVQLNFECILTLTDHTYPVNHLLQLKDGRMASCSADCTIRIWNVKDNFTTSKIIKNECSSSILCLVQLKDNRLACGSADNRINIWDLEDSECTNMLKEHSNTVKSIIQLPDETLVSGSRDNTIKIWK